MTIERLYSLPNCKLILQGLSQPMDGKLDARPGLNILMNAECQFVGYPEPITGGREFFESLVRQVSRYAQEFLSGIKRPESSNGKAELVHLQPMDGDFHQLTVYEVPEDNNPTDMASEPKPPVQVKLTTVQLFDLVEAIDQFLADSRTLPEFNLQLQPLSRRYMKAEKPVAERAMPAAIGLSSLALTALALFALPIPDLKRPEDPVTQPQATTETVPTDSAAPPDPSATPTSGEPLASNLASPTPISNPQELSDLQAQLYEELVSRWTPTTDVTEPLSYRVSVASDGAIVGYKSINEATETETAQTPLPNLLYKPVGTRNPNEPLADFQVTFKPDGTLEINPSGKTEPTETESSNESSSSEQ